jgi:hypothetical protein
MYKDVNIFQYVCIYVNFFTYVYMFTYVYVYIYIHICALSKLGLDDQWLIQPMREYNLLTMAIGIFIL